MTIAAPSRGILNFKTVPVDCTKCEYCGDLTNLTDEAKKALIDSTVFHELEEERLLALSENREPRAFVRDNSKSGLLISQEQNISCDKCGSLFVVPDSFFQMVGQYEDDIGVERSHRWQKNLMKLDENSELKAMSKELNR